MNTEHKHDNPGRRAAPPRQDTLNHLRRIREESGLSKTDVAKRAGLTVSQYFKLEAAERPLKPEYIVALAEAFGKTPAEIINPVFLVGAIRDDGILSFAPEAERPLVATPPQASPTTQAVRVIGSGLDAMGVGDNWLLYFDVPGGHPRDCLGRVCVAWLEEAGLSFDQMARSVRLRRIVRAEGSLYTLISPGNQIEENVPLAAASPVLWYRPRDPLRL